MTYDTFMQQIARLQECYGEKNYGSERQRALWAMYKNLSDYIFPDVVSYLILNHRGTPLMKEFEDAAIKAENWRKETERRDSDARGIFETLKAAYAPANYDDLEVRARIEARLKLVKDYTTRKITKQQFDQGCDFYDQAAEITCD